MGDRSHHEADAGAAAAFEHADLHAIDWRLRMRGRRGRDACGERSKQK
jgi:hypothetical protein